MLQPIKRKPMQHSREMQRSLERVKELYPDNKTFNLSGRIGNNMYFGPFMENKK